MMVKNYITWSGVDQLVDVLCKKILLDLPQIDSVVGIPRGGLIPATLVSHKLGLPYNDGPIGANTLVIDDICDSGNTIKNSIGVYTATLHTKLSAIVQPTLAANILINESQWVVYPWERQDSEPIQDYLK
jgi:hypoxanthine phosphoribosyltransferase